MNELPPKVAYPTNIQPMFEANALIDNPGQLRDRFAKDGYLLFRNVIDQGKLRSLREQITAVLADIGWIADGPERDTARIIGMAHREGEEGYFEALDRLAKLEDLYALAHDANLTKVLRSVLGESVFPHPLSITRLVFPGHPEITTPPHQDYRNNQGTMNLTATWIPLGNCSMDDGGLAILEGSHKAGLVPIQYHHGPGVRAATLSDDLLRLRWVSTDFQLGDVLLFPALAVHSALHNDNPNNMRISVDFRHQLEGEALTPPCLQPHFGRTTWADIYKDWKSDEFKYYWTNLDFMQVPWDSRLLALDAEEQESMEKFHDAMRFEKAKRDRFRARQADDQKAKG
jgi:Protein involved in biosynthesis of mitomycin antibiotics/polyketide fumonisin